MDEKVEAQEGVALIDLYETTINNIQKWGNSRKGGEDIILENVSTAKEAVNIVLNHDSQGRTFIVEELVRGINNRTAPIDIMVYSCLYYNLKNSKSRADKRLANKVKNCINDNGEYIVTEIAKQINNN